jgi:hypothetical protein
MSGTSCKRGCPAGTKHDKKFLLFKRCDAERVVDLDFLLALACHPSEEYQDARAMMPPWTAWRAWITSG